MKGHLSIEGHRLTIEDVRSVARDGTPVKLSDATCRRIENCRSFLERKLNSGETIYGVNTGLGGAAERLLSDEKIRQVQTFQIRSHAAGIGAPMPIEQVRAAMLSRINTHARGYSACRLQVTQGLVDMLNHGVHPVVPYSGSVGASGDLAPMSHVGLVLMGEGEAFYKGERLTAKEALKRANLAPVTMQVRDGLALINGSNFIAGIGALVLADFSAWLKSAEIAACMSFEGLQANMGYLDARIHEIRGFPGAIDCAANLRRLVDGSELLKIKSPRIQEAYSLRSTPQVVGTARDAYRYARVQCEIELNGAGDNPLFLADDKAILNGANFQGTPVGLPLDHLCTAITMVSMLSERRLNRLLNPALNQGLPLFLTLDPGMYSGFMTSQYTVDALLAEQRILCTPASIQSVAASADQEDFVSMGLHAAQKASRILENAQGVIGVEMLAAAQAMHLREGVAGKGTATARKAVHAVVEPLHEDRVLSIDHQKIIQALHSGNILSRVESAVGKLND